MHSVYAYVTLFGLRSSLVIYIHLHYLKLKMFLFASIQFHLSAWRISWVKTVMHNDSLFYLNLLKERKLPKKTEEVEWFWISWVFFCLIPQCHSRFKRVGYQPPKNCPRKKNCCLAQDLVINNLDITCVGVIQKLSIEGSFNPFEKYESKWESFPQIGLKIQKNLWNHHLDHCFPKKITWFQHCQPFEGCPQLWGVR